MRNFLLPGIIVFVLIPFHSLAQVGTTYLWHMDQPIYWPERGLANPKHYQDVKESQDLKSSSNALNFGGGAYHPLNDLYEIFSKDDRVNAYQHRTANTVNNMAYTPDAGAQMSYSGCLIENVNSLAAAGQWGYYSSWKQNFVNVRALQTSDGKPRMDLVAFTMHHALSPLVSERTLRKEIQTHRYIYGQNFGTSPVYSKGYWPAECAFSERIIKALVLEGLEWSIIANSHLARTLADYPLNYGTSGCNVDPPNKADKVTANGVHWYNGQIDGRGGAFASPYCFQAHKAKYVDPETGTEYKMTVVPMAELESYRDGYSAQGTGEIESNIVPYNDPAHKALVLLAHDGDNAWGGGSSYYDEAVPNFVAAAQNNSNLHPTTIQQFLTDNPVPENDVVRVEDGAWFNAESDWGHPQFINWIWPLYNNTTYEFNPDGWTEDARNWAVITATVNYVITAEDLEGTPDIGDIVNSSALSSNSEIAWHFFLGGLNSGYMYYGKALDMEVKQTVSGNNAIQYAQMVLDAHPGEDNTPPSVFIPQRFPYNPGGRGFGPIYGYQEKINTKDFTVWTYGFDVSGIASATLKYRCDENGENPLTDNVNDTYAGGSGVSAWNSLEMTFRDYDPAYAPSDPEINFFVLPDAIADLYYAEITGLSDTLVDYYVEMTDTKGNTFKTPIQHVYVGDESSNINPNVSWVPEEPTTNEFITITSTEATAVSKLHWGVTTGGTAWMAPIEAYWPAGTAFFDVHAVQSPFIDPDNDGVYTVTIGPFNNASQVVSQIDFVIKVSDSYWNNNGGSDYHIAVVQPSNDNPVGSNQAVTLSTNQQYDFDESDFYFMGAGGATFSGIHIINTVTNGNLTYNGSNVANDALCADISLLAFSPDNNESGSPYTSFTFKVRDNLARESDATYIMTINVTDSRPTSAHLSAITLTSTDYNFTSDEFTFTSTTSATFSGVKITMLPEAGLLKSNSTPVVLNEDYNAEDLVFTPTAGQTGSPYASFWFKVKDSDGQYSNTSYKATIYVLSQINSGVSWIPSEPTSNEQITIFVKDDPKMNTSGLLHWGVNNWQSPLPAYRPEGTTVFGTGPAVQTYFSGSGNLYQVKIGPLNNPSQPATRLDFVLHYSDDSWGHNTGNTDWLIPVTNTIGIVEKKLENIKIAPVPFDEYTTITIGETGTFRVELVDLSGKIIAQRGITAPRDFMLQRGNLKSGMYFLRFIETQSGRSVVKSIIVN